MQIVEPSYQIKTPIHPPFNKSILYAIEDAGRKAWKSEGKITSASAPAFVRMLVREKKHESVIEHQSITVDIVCDRGLSHEIVRHRICAFTQSSTRFIKYNEARGMGGIQLIHPRQLNAEQRKRREDFFWRCQELYDAEIAEGLGAQIARGVLPHALKTELAWTANLREWRHILALRTEPDVHPQLRELLIPLLAEFQVYLEPIFGDLKLHELKAT